MYGHEYRDQPRRFLGERDQTTALIRQKVLRLGHYARVQSPIINRIRQDLAWQFPEIAQTEGITAWRWLAGVKDSPKYDKKHSESVGLGVKDETRSHAKRLVELWKDEDLLERELADLMGKDPRFMPYKQVLSSWGMGVRCQAAIISQIYPISSFCDDDGKPLVVWGKSRKNKDKRTKRHLGLRRFCKALGLAPTERSSGDKESKQIVGGSDVCRRHIWLWCYTRIEVKRNRLATGKLDALCQMYDTGKTSGKPMKLLRMQVCAKAVKLLFYELITAAIPLELDQDVIQESA